MTSSYTTGISQKDGRVSARESIIDDFGVTHIFEYIAAANFNFATALAARATWLAPYLKAAEAQRLFANLTGFTFQHNTPTELAAAFRAEYKDSKGRRTAELARWVLNGIDSGAYTDAGIRNAFGLSVANYNALKAKFTLMRTWLNDTEASQGE